MTEWADQDPEETREWIESLEAMIQREGTELAHFLLDGLIDKARRSGASLPYSANTAYLNTPVAREQRSRGTRPSSGAFASSFVGTRWPW